MKLLTKEIRDRIPALYSTDGQAEESPVIVKFFTPDSGWTWYAIEGEPVLNDQGVEVDFTFFGLVSGLEEELGYFSLNELQSARGPLGLAIERDRLFANKTIKEVRR